MKWKVGSSICMQRQPASRNASNSLFMASAMHTVRCDVLLAARPGIELGGTLRADALAGGRVHPALRWLRCRALGGLRRRRAVRAGQAVAGGGTGAGVADDRTAVGHGDSVQDGDGVGGPVRRGLQFSKNVRAAKRMDKAQPEDCPTG